MANSQRVVVVSKPLRVQAFLRDELGLTPEILRGGLEEGIAAAALCTRHHPPNFGGLRLWAEAVRSLRDQLAPLGWHRDDSFNYSTVVRDDGALGIAVARGDAGTGIDDRHPTTQHSKGAVTQRTVQHNAFLPYDHLPPGYGEESGTPTPTWLLLHHQDGTEVRCELSFPIGIDESGFVTRWGQRVILTPIGLDPDRLPILDDEPVEPDVIVERRA